MVRSAKKDGFCPQKSRSLDCALKIANDSTLDQQKRWFDRAHSITIGIGLSCFLVGNAPFTNPNPFDLGQRVSEEFMETIVGGAFRGDRNWRSREEHDRLIEDMMGENRHTKTQINLWFVAA